MQTGATMQGYEMRYKSEIFKMFVLELDCSFIRVKPIRNRLVRLSTRRKTISDFIERSSAILPTTKYQNRAT